MSLDFSDVVSITIPEGSVKGIAINGVAVWGTPKILDRIYITFGTKNNYDVNQTFVDPIITAYYTDGTSANVSALCTSVGGDTSTVGTKLVTTSYTEGGITKTVTYNIYVRSFETIWTGQKNISWTMSSSTVPSSVDVYTDSTLTTGNYRFTYSMSDSSGPPTSPYYFHNGNNTLDKPNNPNTCNGINPSNDLQGILGCVGKKVFSSTPYKYIKLNWDATNHKFVSVAGYSSGTSGGATTGTISLNITKIEKQTGGPTVED